MSSDQPQSTSPSRQRHQPPSVVHPLARPKASKSPDPNWASLLASLPAEVQASFDQPEPEPTHWYLVEQMLGEMPVISSFDTVEDLRAHLMAQAYQADTLNAIFVGQRAYISNSRLPYLMLPDGQALPLFEVPEKLEASEYGFRGEIEESLAPPMAVDPSETDAPTEEDAEEPEETEAEEEEEFPADEDDRDDDQPSDESWEGEPVDDDEDELGDG